MRIAIVGKGGSGKSSLAAGIARALARRGHQVLAMDADAVPGLGAGLGLVGDDWMLDGLARHEDGSGWVLDVSPDEIVERHAWVGADGVRFLQFGKVRDKLSRDQQTSAAAFVELVSAPFAAPWTVVVDLAAGTRQAYFGWTGAADTVLAVVEPSWKSLLTLRRFASLRGADPDRRFLGIANKIRTPAEEAFVGRELAALDVPCIGVIPYLEEISASARRPDSVAPVPEAVERTVDALIASDDPRRRCG